MDNRAPDRLQGLTAELQQYLDTSKEYLQLQVFKMTMLLVTAVSKSLLVGALAVLALVFLSWAAAWAINAWLNSEALGFLIVGVVYLLATVIGYRFRDRLDAPILTYFSRKYYES